MRKKTFKRLGIFILIFLWLLSGWPTIWPPEIKNIHAASGDVILLWDTANETQLKFYDEGAVLGEEMEREIQAEKKFNIFTVIVDGVERIDRFILTLWENLLGLLS